MNPSPPRICVHNTIEKCERARVRVCVYQVYSCAVWACLYVLCARLCAMGVCLKPRKLVAQPQYMTGKEFAEGTRTSNGLITTSSATLKAARTHCNRYPSVSPFYAHAHAHPPTQTPTCIPGGIPTSADERGGMIPPGAIFMGARAGGGCIPIPLGGRGPMCPMGGTGAGTALVECEVGERMTL